MPPLPSSRLLRGTASASLVALTLLAAPSCSSDDAPPPTTTTTTTAPSDEETTTTTGDTGTTTTTEADEGSEGDATLPEWARPFETTGDKLTTIEGESFTVDVYQVGTTEAPEDGMFVDPDTNEPILKAGDELVFVNYVITNTGDEPISLSYTLVDVTATYANWEWLQGMDGASDRDLFEEMGVLSSALAPTGDEAPFIWEPGASFAYGDNFAYQPGGAITFEATLTPADEEGELLHDQREEVEVETTIT